MSDPNIFSPIDCPLCGQHLRDSVQSLWSADQHVHAVCKQIALLTEIAASLATMSGMLTDLAAMLKPPPTPTKPPEIATQERDSTK